MLMMKSAQMPQRCERKEDKGKPINILILAFAMQDQQQNNTNKWRISSKRSIAKLVLTKMVCAVYACVCVSLCGTE